MTLTAERRAAHLEKLRAATGLTWVDFAHWVVGRGFKTIYNVLGGKPGAAVFAAWLDRIEEVTFDGERIYLVIRRGVKGPQWKRKRADRSPRVGRQKLV